MRDDEMIVYYVRNMSMKSYRCSALNPKGQINFMIKIFSHAKEQSHLLLSFSKNNNVNST